MRRSQFVNRPSGIRQAAFGPRVASMESWLASLSPLALWEVARNPHVSPLCPLLSITALSMCHWGIKTHSLNSLTSQRSAGAPLGVLAPLRLQTALGSLVPRSWRSPRFRAKNSSRLSLNISVDYLSLKRVPTISLPVPRTALHAKMGLRHREATLGAWLTKTMSPAKTDPVDCPPNV